MPSLPEWMNLEKVNIHIRNLKQALNQGFVFKKFDAVIKFIQNAWLKPYINMNTVLHKKTKNDFEINFFKLMNNAVFVKPVKNVGNMEILNLLQQREEGII